MASSEGLVQQVYDSGYREVEDDIYCLKFCTGLDSFGIGGNRGRPTWIDQGRKEHGSYNAFVIKDDCNIMFDTLPAVNTEGAIRLLKEVLDGEALDFVIVSHPESPHAANAWAILDEYPDATVVASENGSDHELYGFSEDNLFVSDGDTIDLGHHTVEFVDPVFFDLAMTTYMFEHKTNSLFTVDWIGFTHMDTECLCFADEMKYDLDKDQLKQFLKFTFLWLKFADASKVNPAIDDLISRTEPSLIAPAHGQVIRSDVDELIQTIQTIIKEVTEDDLDRALYVPDVHPEEEEA